MLGDVSWCLQEEARAAAAEAQRRRQEEAERARAQAAEAQRRKQEEAARAQAAEAARRKQQVLQEPMSWFCWSAVGYAGAACVLAACMSAGGCWQAILFNAVL